MIEPIVGVFLLALLVAFVAWAFVATAASCSIAASCPLTSSGAARMTTINSCARRLEMEKPLLPHISPCSWSGGTLTLRYSIPKVWTQKSGRAFGIYWSDSLGFGRLWPEPTTAELAAFYDVADYDRYLLGTRMHQDARPTLVSRAITKLAWIADKSQTDCRGTIIRLAPDAKSACDIGCGNGAYLEMMRSAGLLTTGIDPSPVSASAIKSKGIEFFAGTAEQLPSIKRSFDVVSMFQSLEHCREPLKAVTNAASLLAHDGLLVIEVPNMGCLGFEAYGAAWWHADAGRHLQFFTRRSLDTLLRQAGLRAIAWEYQGFTQQFSPHWISDMNEVWEASALATPKPSLLRSAAYLPRAALSSLDRKYEIIRVYARRS